MADTSRAVFQTLKAWLAAAAVATMLAACGGGGDGGGTPPPASTAILDSFGQPVGSDAGIGDGDSGADGTAGEGKPIANGTVTITDSAGRSVSSTTNAEGYYRAKVTGFTPPFVVRVTAGGRTYTSLNVQPIVRNGFITINISGLTDKVASDVARAGGASGAAQLTPALVAANQAVIQTSLAALRTQLADVIRSAGLDPNTFDPIGVPFRADHTGYDKVLDNVVVTVGADGSTQVAPVPAAGGGNNNPGALAGNWNLTLTVEGTAVPVGVVPGSAVPSEQAITANSLTSAVQQFSAQYSTYTVTTSGSNLHITGPNTDYNITIHSASVSNYQGCGACGVGSQVSFNMSISFTASGTLDGFSEPAMSHSSNFLFVYVRQN